MPYKSISFITEVPSKFIFTDNHVRRNYYPNKATVYNNSVFVILRN